MKYNKYKHALNIYFFQAAPHWIELMAKQKQVMTIVGLNRSKVRSSMFVELQTWNYVLQKAPGIQ